ncbi:hypothetical protein CBER1_06645 [Cercospora berteroae]|uniref:BTB domain-containing protein n=1 Tax=Cercospora berteroae TaxID=357750 RepID=A0A2S6C4A7_9PEZI|nr:hypothetical protein CBER1_06645 [Cercospora berteroae]
MANETARRAFYDKLSDLHNKDDLTDFVIVCHDHQWNVHRLVLALHSDVLSKACSSGFKESREKTINLSPGHQPEVIEALVEYMYTFDYSLDNLDETETIGLHIDLAILADKYNIEGLHQMATYASKQLVPDAAAASLAFAVSRAYAAPAATKEICQAICATVAERTELLENEEGKVLVQFMEENGSFAVDVARKIAASRQSPATGKEGSARRLSSRSGFELLSRSMHIMR